MKPEFIIFFLSNPILTVIVLVLYNYFRKKSINQADLEDQPEIAALIESAKAPIQKALSLEIESFKNQYDLIKNLKEKEFQIKFLSYNHTIERVIKLDSLISEVFWIDLDRSRTESANDDQWKRLLELRRFVFDSTLYTNKDVISSALDLVVTFETLFRIPKNELHTADQYYKKLSFSTSSKLDRFKDLCKKNYHFDDIESSIYSSKDLVEHYKTHVDSGENRETRGE